MAVNLDDIKQRLQVRRHRVPNGLRIGHRRHVSTYVSNRDVGEPGGTRTRDPMIKSHVLYQLSYGLRARV